MEENVWKTMDRVLSHGSSVNECLIKILVYSTTCPLVRHFTFNVTFTFVPR